jgi:flagellar FliL protein
MKTIITLVVVVLVMAGAAFFVVSKFLAPQEAAVAEEPAEPPAHDKHGSDTGKAGGEIFMVEELLVNPTGTSGTRFLSASIGLEVAGHETVVQLEGQQMPVRDLLITILSSRTVEQLTNTTEREMMRGEITERLNKLLGPDKILAVYFVDYVLQ